MVYVYEDQHKYYEKIKNQKNKLKLEKYHANNPKCICGLRLNSKDHELSSKHNKYLYEEKLKETLGKENVDKYLYPMMGKYPKLTSKINDVTKKTYKKFIS